MPTREWLSRQLIKTNIWQTYLMIYNPLFVLDFCCGGWNICICENRTYLIYSWTKRGASNKMHDKKNYAKMWDE